MDSNLRRSERHIQSDAVLQEADLKEQRKVLVRSISLILKKNEDERSCEDRNLLASHQLLAEDIQKRSKFNADIKMRNLEIEDGKDSIKTKCNKLASAIKKSKHLIIYTGAGISTAASIPDYRGPNGVWTLLKQGKQCSIPDLLRAQPTFTHMAISQLYKMGYLKHVVSQNCDGLHMRSDLPSKHLSEVHGNMHVEICRLCSPVKEYIRLFDVTEKTAMRRHKTDRYCHKCAAPLFDTIVHFGEKGRLDTVYNWHSATMAARKADVIVCLGTSLKVLKKYSCLWPTANRPFGRRPQLYIVNLQWTPKDRYATLKINGKCDLVMKLVMQKLQIKVPTYTRKKDPIFKLAFPLSKSELYSTSKPLLKLGGFKGRPKGSLNKTKIPFDANGYSNIGSLDPNQTIEEYTDISISKMISNSTFEDYIDILKSDNDEMVPSEYIESDALSKNCIFDANSKSEDSIFKSISLDNTRSINDLSTSKNTSVSSLFFNKFASNSCFNRQPNCSRKKIKALSHNSLENKIGIKLMNKDNHIDSLLKGSNRVLGLKGRPKGSLNKLKRFKCDLDFEFSHSDHSYLSNSSVSISSNDVDFSSKSFRKAGSGSRLKGILNKVRRKHEIENCDQSESRFLSKNNFLNKSKSTASNSILRYIDKQERPKHSPSKRRKCFSLDDKIIIDSEKNGINSSNNVKFNQLNNYSEENISKLNNNNSNATFSLFENECDIKPIKYEHSNPIYSKGHLNKYLSTSLFHAKDENDSKFNLSTSYVPLFNFPRVMIKSCDNEFKTSNSIMNILPTSNIYNPSNLNYSKSNCNLNQVSSLKGISIDSPVHSAIEMPPFIYNEYGINVSSLSVIKPNNLSIFSSPKINCTITPSFKLANLNSRKTLSPVNKDIHTSIINNGNNSTILSYNINNLLLKNSITKKVVYSSVNCTTQNHNNSINLNTNIMNTTKNSGNILFMNLPEKPVQSNIVKTFPLLQSVSNAIDLIKMKEIELTKVIETSGKYEDLKLNRILPLLVPISNNTLNSLSVNLIPDNTTNSVNSNYSLNANENYLYFPLDDFINIQSNKISNTNLNAAASQIDLTNFKANSSANNGNGNDYRYTLDNCATIKDLSSTPSSHLKSNVQSFISSNGNLKSNYHPSDIKLIRNIDFRAAEKEINFLIDSDISKCRTILPTNIHPIDNCSISNVDKPDKLAINKISNEKIIKKLITKDLNIKRVFDLERSAPGWFGKGLTFTKKKKVPTATLR